MTEDRGQETEDRRPRTGFGLRARDREKDGRVEGRKPLKILHIDPEIGWGGGERQVIGLVSYLSRWGHQSHLLCHPGGRLNGEAQDSGIKTFPISIRNHLDVRPVLSVRRMVREEKYDIVHFHTGRAHALSFWLGRIRPEVKYVVTRRMDYPIKKNWYHRYLYNQRVDGVVAISQKIASLLVEGGVRQEKIRVIHSGIEPASYQQAQEERAHFDVPVVGTVAVLEERKGHRFLLEAAALLKQQGCRLIYRFAGEGTEKERLEKMALDLNLREEVFFMGFLSDIRTFLASIDIFVLPSIYEGFGVAVLEAMAAGKPVVAAGVGGIPELVEDQVTGLLVPGMDPSALAKAISQLLAQKDRMRQMGERGRERVQKYFTMEEMAKKNEDHYYELLGA